MNDTQVTLSLRWNGTENFKYLELRHSTPAYFYSFPMFSIFLFSYSEEQTRKLRKLPTDKATTTRSTQ